MKSILSTKILSISQKELLLNAGVSLVEYDAISVSKIDFETPVSIENAIISSKHAAEAILEKDIAVSRFFVVGESSARLLEEKGQNVVKKANNASELAKMIVKSEISGIFYFYCGSHRREEIPAILKKQNFALFEVKTYQTELNLRRFNRFFDGILFFSPSGVISFTRENDLGESTAFCIGGTTGSEAKKHTSKVVIANSTSVESVIAKSVKTLVYESH